MQMFKSCSTAHVLFFSFSSMAQRQHTVVSERDLAQVLCRSGREAEDRRAKKDIWSCDGEDESPRRRRDQARREWHRFRDKRKK